MYVPVLLRILKLDLLEAFADSGVALVSSKNALTRGGNGFL